MLDRMLLLDVAGQQAAGKPDPLPPGFEISGRRLEDAMKAQAVALRMIMKDSALHKAGDWNNWPTAPPITPL